MLHAGVSAIRADRTLIRDCLREVYACILEAINPWKDLRPDHVAQRFVPGIRAAVIDVSRDNRGNHAILIESGTSVEKSPLVTVGARSDVFRARLHPLDWTSPSFFRGQCAHRHLRIARNLDTEASTNIGGLYAYAIDVNAEVGRKKLDRK